MDHNQKGWVQALPWVCFYIMNTVNTLSTFLPFQLHIGCLPCLIPPLKDSLGHFGSEPEAAKLFLK